MGIYLTGLIASFIFVLYNEIQFETELEFKNELNETKINWVEVMKTCLLLSIFWFITIFVLVADIIKKLNKIS